MAFSSATGSPYWLKRAESLDFDPRADVRRFEDLALFPNVADELRDVRVQDLIPRGTFSWLPPRHASLPLR